MFKARSLQLFSMFVSSKKFNKFCIAIGETEGDSLVKVGTEIMPDKISPKKNLIPRKNVQKPNNWASLHELNWSAKIVISQ